METEYQKNPGTFSMRIYVQILSKWSKSKNLHYFKSIQDYFWQLGKYKLMKYWNSTTFEVLEETKTLSEDIFYATKYDWASACNYLTQRIVGLYPKKYLKLANNLHYLRIESPGFSWYRPKMKTCVGNLKND